MQTPVIFHIDVNSAFLSWEAVSRLEQGLDMVDLRTIPSAVGGDKAKRHGVILAKSIPAKKYHVRTGEPVVDALRKCPELVLVSPNHKMYEEKSKAFMAILRNYSDKVEKCSIDEAFIDMTGTKTLFGEPVEVAHRIKDEIYETLGFTVNVGISNNKLLAKMASDFKKPNLVHTLYPHEIEAKMWPLPVGELYSVGRASQTRLKALGIRTIGQLAKADVNMLRSHLKKQGEMIWNYANGRADDVVEATPTDNKCYGNSTTIAFDVTEAQAAKKVLLSLTETVGRRLRKDCACIEVVSVQIRYFDFTNVSHQMVLTAPTNITKEIYDSVCQLFDELWDGTPIRLLGVQTSKVSKEGSNRQMSLFDQTDYEKLEKLDRAMDHIRERFGTDAILRASFLEQSEKDSDNRGSS